MPRAATSVATSAWTALLEGSQRTFALALRTAAVDGGRSTPAAASCWASRSAPWRVRQNTIVEPCRSIERGGVPRRVGRRSTCQNTWSTSPRRCSIWPTSWRHRVVLVLPDEHVDVAVERRREQHRLAIVGGRGRAAGGPAGRKPMSAMRSASSMTTISTSSSSTSPLFDEVDRDGRGRRRGCRRRCGAPCGCGVVADAAVDGDDPAARGRGRAARAPGDLGGELAGRREDEAARAGAARPGVTRSTSGMPKASVLPEPVGARPQMSRPARASGMVAAWMGKGSVMPRLCERVDEVGGNAEIGEAGRQRNSSQWAGKAGRLESSRGPGGETADERSATAERCRHSVYSTRRRVRSERRPQAAPR